MKTIFHDLTQTNINGKRTQGFTLIELFVVLAIFFVLASITIPAMIKWRPYYNFRSTAADFVSDLQLARINAIKRGVNCTVEFTANGYRIFEDTNADLQLDTGERILKTVTWNSGSNIKYVSRESLASTSTGTTTGGSLDVISFRPDGIAFNSTGATALPGGGIITLSDSGGNVTRVIEIAVAGSIRMEAS